MKGLFGDVISLKSSAARRRVLIRIARIDGGTGGGKRSVPYCALATQECIQMRRVETAKWPLGCLGPCRYSAMLLFDRIGETMGCYGASTSKACVYCLPVKERLGP